VPALLAALRAVLDQPPAAADVPGAEEAATASADGADGKSLALELLSTAAHELRSPVTALQGLAEVVTEDFDKLDDATKQHVLGGIKRQSARLVRVVEDLLTAARLESGGVEVGIGPTEVLPCVRLAQETLSLDSDTLEIEGGHGVVALGDGDRIVQILVNYLSNAVRYGRPPYRVEVNGVATGDVAIAVHDRGAGVPDEFIPRLFEKFSRASTRGPGTGLGLYIVKALAEAQGGHVWYERSPDGGACFGLRLGTP
jgi:signal transduction histidine kinase